MGVCSPPPPCPPYIHSGDSSSNLSGCVPPSPAEPSYPKVDPGSAARRSWELRTFISQSKGEAWEGVALVTTGSQALLHGVTFYVESRFTWSRVLRGVMFYVESRFTWCHVLHTGRFYVVSCFTLRQVLHRFRIYMVSHFYV